MDRVVLEGDDPLRAGAHTDSATAAAQGEQLGRALFVLVEGSERAFLGAALALRAALEEEVRVGRVAGARVDRLAAFGHLDALDGFHRGTGAVLGGLHRVHRRVHGAGGVDACAAGLIGEADEVRVREAVPESRQVRSLAVVEVEDFGALVAGKLLGTDRRFLSDLRALRVFGLVA